jgi:hypothetical protein
MTDKPLNDSLFAKLLAAAVLIAAFGFLTKFLWDWAGPPKPKVRVLNRAE